MDTRSGGEADRPSTHGCRVSAWSLEAVICSTRRWFVPLYSISDQPIGATVRDGQVELDESSDWPDGTRLLVTPVCPPLRDQKNPGHVIIVGFGLAGRCVADLLRQTKLSYTIIEKNAVTVATQKALGRDILEGDVLNADTLMEAGLGKASILALTIPDEDAVLGATELARRLKPDIYIIARTNYSSKGMRAAQLGADEVVKAEQAVALQFYEKMSKRILRTG